jgi:hypothetical protein
MDVLAYDPQRLAALARLTAAAADELAAVTSDEPRALDAVATAHAIAASLDEQLVVSLRAVLGSTAMTEWTGSPPAPFELSLMGFDQLLVALDERAAGDAVPAIPIVAGFTLAASIRAAEPMQWFADVHRGCVGFRGGSYLGGGYVDGPDGERYPIVVPRVETADGDVYTADRHATAPGEPSIATLAGSDAGWEVVACASGVERFQAAPSALERSLGAIAATTGRVGPLPPNGPLTSIAMPIGGPPFFAETPTTPLPVPPRARGGGPSAVPPTPGDVVAGAVGLGITAGQAAAVSVNLDNQNERAYQVIFERNPDGRRRARVRTFRLHYGADGDVEIVPEHVFVNADGELTAQPIRYGSPDGADGVWITAAPGDVVASAFSGDDPRPQPVTAAMFP